jgi:hypothetical protein
MLKSAQLKKAAEFRNTIGPKSGLKTNIAARQLSAIAEVMGAPSFMT